MYIRRKVFSIGYDENGEERLFSTNELLNEESYLRMFAEKEEEKKDKKKGRDIRNIKSHRGLGRSLILGDMGGALGAYLTKEEANKLAKEGKSDQEIIDSVGKSGMKKGAVINAGMYGLAGLRGGAANAAATAGLGAVKGAVGGLLGARKNAKVRLRKYKEDKK